ncbi:hypothetical protein SDC9_05419 [bioreactor metagenome]|uniref:Uncharacterized protein n=1 Tax=bioreactor metagenome TaxID=1076179 RepID=A0A644SZ08_9ZZZZ
MVREAERHGEHREQINGGDDQGFAQASDSLLDIAGDQVAVVVHGQAEGKADTIGLVEGVRVGVIQPLAPGRLEENLHGLGFSVPAGFEPLAVDDRELSGPGLGVPIEYGGGSVGGIVVVNDDFHGLVTLGEEGIEACRDALFLVPGRDEDGDQRAGFQGFRACAPAHPEGVDGREAEGEEGDGQAEPGQIRDDSRKDHPPILSSSLPA